MTLIKETIPGNEPTIGCCTFLGLMFIFYYQHHPLVLVHLFHCAWCSWKHCYIHCRLVQQGKERGSYKPTLIIFNTIQYARYCSQQETSASPTWPFLTFWARYGELKQTFNKEKLGTYCRRLFVSWLEPSNQHAFFSLPSQSL